MNRKNWVFSIGNENEELNDEYDLEPDKILIAFADANYSNYTSKFPTDAEYNTFANDIQNVIGNNLEASHDYTFEFDKKYLPKVRSELKSLGYVEDSNFDEIDNYW